MSIEIRYAADDADVVNIHRFLCAVAGPTLPGKIDAKASIEEVWRVINDDVALMAIDSDNKLVGTLGLACPEFWWNPNIKFWANRFFFSLPGSRSAKPLLKEARAIAEGSNLELHIYDERRGRLTIFNKSKLRQEKTDVLR